MTGDSSGTGQLGRLGKDVKADGCRQAIGERSTATAGKGGRPTTRDGPESTGLGPAVVPTAYTRVRATDVVVDDERERRDIAYPGSGKGLIRGWGGLTVIEGALRDCALFNQREAL